MQPDHNPSSENTNKKKLNYTKSKCYAQALLVASLLCAKENTKMLIRIKKRAQKTQKRRFSEKIEQDTVGIGK